MSSALRFLAAGLWILGFGREAVGDSLPCFLISDATMERTCNALFLETVDLDGEKRPATSEKGDWFPRNRTKRTFWRRLEAERLFWFSPAEAGVDRKELLEEWKRSIEGTPVDDYGYVWSAPFTFEPATGEVGALPGQGLEIPTYEDSLGGMTGFEWNGETFEGWTTKRTVRERVEEGFLKFDCVGFSPNLQRTDLSVSAEQAAFLEMDVSLDVVDFNDGKSRHCEIDWQTSKSPVWSGDKSFNSLDFSTCRPVEYASGERVRAVFPIHLDRDWKDEVRVLRIRPFVPWNKRFGRFRVNYLRFNYDTREPGNNGEYILAVWKHFLWTGDEAFFRLRLRDLRRAAMFILVHQIDEGSGLADHRKFFVGHDGLGIDEEGRPRPGHGIGGGYFDRLSYGPIDLETNLTIYEALRAMARIEAYLEEKGIEIAKGEVRNRNGRTIAYVENEESLTAKADFLAAAIRERFWEGAAERLAAGIGSSGERLDYGNVWLNLRATALGVLRREQSEKVLDWIDGRRKVKEDTVTGDGIYPESHAPRFTTRNNSKHYVWTWLQETPEGKRQFGAEADNGGLVFWVSHWDVRARAAIGRTESAWKRYAAACRSGLESIEMEREGRSATGSLPLLIPESSLVPAAFVPAFLGIDVKSPGELTIAPNMPKGVSFLGIENLRFRKQRLKAVVRTGEIDLTGSVMAPEEEWTLRLIFPRFGVGEPKLLKDGIEATTALCIGPDRVTYIDETPAPVVYQLVESSDL